MANSSQRWLKHSPIAYTLLELCYSPIMWHPRPYLSIKHCPLNMSGSLLTILDYSVAEVTLWNCQD